MAKKCKCKDWKENIAKVDIGSVISYIHGHGGYTGKVFEYCPWCAKKLEEQTNEEAK